MNVLCKASNTANDVRCSICGQGFLVYWTQTPSSELPSWRTEIASALRAQHVRGDDAHVHPSQPFLIAVGERAEDSVAEDTTEMATA